MERALRALPPAGGSGGGGPGRRAAGGPGGGGPLRRRGPVAARHISTSAGHCLPRRLERRCRAAAGGWEERVGRFRRRRPAAGGRRRAVPGEWRDEPPRRRLAARGRHAGLGAAALVRRSGRPAPRFSAASRRW